MIRQSQRSDNFTKTLGSNNLCFCASTARPFFMTEFNLDFRDTATAYADKTNAELKEKYRLFGMLNSPMLNALGSRFAKFALSAGLPVKGMIKSTIFRQFCGGET